jgi:hypothetical protein
MIHETYSKYNKIFPADQSSAKICEMPFEQFLKQSKKQKVDFSHLENPLIFLKGLCDHHGFPEVYKKFLDIKE